MKTLYWLSLALLIASCAPEKKESLAKCTETYLIYLSKASGNFDLYKNDLNGNETQLTDNPSWDWSPMWNPALASIIYYAYVNDTFQIRQMDLKGNLLSLDNKGLVEFNLSPDGTTLVMEESRGDNRQLVLVNLEDLNRTSITDSTSYNGRAKWSPNSEKIVYISDTEGNNEVYLYDLNQKTTTRLTNNTTSEKYLSWSPNSDQIAYSTEYFEENKPDRNDLFIMNLNTLEVTQITNNAYEDSEIAWSPAGDKIAFHSKRDSIDHIFTMDTDGSNVQQVTTQNTYHGEPVWAVIEKECEE